MNIAGVVVTYNRKTEIEKNISRVLGQTRILDRLYVIDNASSDGTFDYLAQKGLLDTRFVEYVSLKQNEGGAGGFYHGMKRAYEDGYDFIYLMDDDGHPASPDTVEAILSAAERLYAQGKQSMMINSLVICDTAMRRLSFGLGTYRDANELEGKVQEGIFERYINPFNGTLVSKELVREIGFPNKDFFIRGDEVDYQRRAAKAGAFIGTVVDSVYYHPTFELLPVRWRGRTIYAGTFTPWKSYYHIRNYIYSRKRGEGLASALKEFIFQWYCSGKINPEHRVCRRFMIKGLADGLRGRLGKRVEPGQKTL